MEAALFWIGMQPTQQQAAYAVISANSERNPDGGKKVLFSMRFSQIIHLQLANFSNDLPFLENMCACVKLVSLVPIAKPLVSQEESS